MKGNHNFSYTSLMDPIYWHLLWKRVHQSRFLPDKVCLCYFQTGTKTQCSWPHQAHLLEAAMTPQKADRNTRFSWTIEVASHELRQRRLAKAFIINSCKSLTVFISGNLQSWGLGRGTHTILRGNVKSVIFHLETTEHGIWLGDLISHNGSETIKKH